MKFEVSQGLSNEFSSATMSCASISNLLGPHQSNDCDLVPDGLQPPSQNQKGALCNQAFRSSARIHPFGKSFLFPFAEPNMGKTGCAMQLRWLRGFPVNKSSRHAHVAGGRMEPRPEAAMAVVCHIADSAGALIAPIRPSYSRCFC